VSTTLIQPELGVDRVVTLLTKAGFVLDEPSRIRRVVLDTFDGRLHRAGLRLEAVTGDDRSLELSSSGGSPPARVSWNRSAPTVAADLPAGPFGQRLVPLVAERALLEVVDVAADERIARLRDRRGKTVVAAVLRDRLETATGDDTPADLPPWLLTVDAATGHAVEAERVLARLSRAGMHAHEAPAIDVLAGLLGRSLAGRESSPTVPLDPSEDALVAVRTVLSNLAHTIVDNLPGTLADLDPEFLHELRVAIRRTRSVLAETKGVVPKDIRSTYRLAFKELGTITGRTRDLDVYVMGWDDLVAPLHLGDAAATAPVLAALEAHRRRAHKAMARALDSPETRDVLAAWQSWLADPGPTEPAGPIGAVVAERIIAAQEVLLSAGRAIDSESPAEALHDLRKDAKVLRYLLECFGGVLDKQERKAFVTQLKALQDNLGEHQDTEVQLDELRSVAHDLHAANVADTDALLAVGRLVDHLERRRQAARAEFTERFAAYDTKPNRALLAALVAPVASS
jgi:CHAD domain-containing protein